MLVEVLKQCEDNLSRPNIMAKATQLHALAPMLLPGITMNTTTEFQLLKQLCKKFKRGKYLVARCGSVPQSSDSAKEDAES